MTHELLWLVPSFFAVALVYSMAGFGGGSSYLALLALTGLSYKVYPSISLLCNLIVVGSGLFFFARAGHLRWRQILPFFIGSIPAAWWGGKIPIPERTFTLLLALSLVLASFRLLMNLPNERESQNEPTTLTVWTVGLPVGLLIGFWSGLVGIGGGIFLSPFLMLIGWADAKQAAAAASLFIGLNSAAGLIARLPTTPLPLDLVIPLLAVVFVGGQLGARLGSRTFSKIVVQRVTAGLILIVAVKLFGRLV